MPMRFISAQSCFRVVGGMLLFCSMAFTQDTACQRAEVFFRQKQWPQAAEAYAECEATAQGQTDALLFRAKALVNAGDYSGAADDLDKYTAAHPNSDDALYLYGYVRFRQNQPRQSLESFSRAAKITAPKSDDLKIAALDYVLLNDYVSAARYLEQSLTMNPADIEAWYHLGRVRYQQGRVDAAIAAFQELVKRDPTNVKGHDNLGLCFEAKNQTSAALAEYKKAVSLDGGASTTNEQPYLNLGKLLVVLNQAGEGIPLLRHAAQIAPQSATVHYELARAELTAGNIDAARREVEESVKLNNANGPAHYLLGRIYRRLGQSEQADAEFKLTEELIRKQNASSGGMATGRR